MAIQKLIYSIENTDATLLNHCACVPVCNKMLYAYVIRQNQLSILNVKSKHSLITRVKS